MGDLERRVRLKRVYRAYEVDPEPSLTLLRRQSSFVPGVGSETARVVFVGEAPGRTEDRLRRPFVGKSGKLLDEMLASIGSEREQVYITNVVKYRPVDEHGGNRAPSDQEVSASVPYLKREVSILSPSVVVPLGRFATSVFLPRRKLGEVVGREYLLPGYSASIVPLYHPAVGVYDPRRKAGLIEQFGVLKEHL